jgi:hypothetical protein
MAMAAVAIRIPMKVSSIQIMAGKLDHSTLTVFDHLNIRLLKEFNCVTFHESK